MESSDSLSDSSSDISSVSRNQVPFIVPPVIMNTTRGTSVVPSQRTESENILINDAKRNLLSVLNMGRSKLPATQLAYFHSFVRTELQNQMKRKQRQMFKNRDLDVSVMTGDDVSLAGSLRSGLAGNPFQRNVPVNPWASSGGRAPSVVSAFSGVSHIPPFEATQNVFSDPSSGYHSGKSNGPELNRHGFNYPHALPGSSYVQQSYLPAQQGYPQFQRNHPQEFYPPTQVSQQNRDGAPTQNVNGTLTKTTNRTTLLEAMGSSSEDESEDELKSRRNTGKSTIQCKAAKPQTSSRKHERNSSVKESTLVPEKPSRQSTKVIKIRKWYLKLENGYLHVGGVDRDKTPISGGPIIRAAQGVLSTNHGEFQVCGAALFTKRVPDYVTKACLKGFPSRWRVLTAKWTEDVRKNQKSAKRRVSQKKSLTHSQSNKSTSSNRCSIQAEETSQKKAAQRRSKSMDMPTNRRAKPSKPCQNDADDSLSSDEDVTIGHCRSKSASNPKSSSVVLNPAASKTTSLAQRSELTSTRKEVTVSRAGSSKSVDVSKTKHGKNKLKPKKLAPHGSKSKSSFPSKSIPLTEESEDESHSSSDEEQTIGLVTEDRSKTPERNRSHETTIDSYVETPKSARKPVKSRDVSVKSQRNIYEPRRVEEVPTKKVNKHLKVVQEQGSDTSWDNSANRVISPTPEKSKRAKKPRRADPASDSDDEPKSQKVVKKPVEPASKFPNQKFASKAGCSKDVPEKKKGMAKEKCSTGMPKIRETLAKPEIKKNVPSNPTNKGKSSKPGKGKEEKADKENGSKNSKENPQGQKPLNNGPFGKENRHGNIFEDLEENDFDAGSEWRCMTPKGLIASAAENAPSFKGRCTPPIQGFSHLLNSGGNRSQKSNASLDSPSRDFLEENNPVSKRMAKAVQEVPKKAPKRKFPESPEYKSEVRDLMKALRDDAPRTPSVVKKVFRGEQSNDSDDNTTCSFSP